MQKNDFPLIPWMMFILIITIVVTSSLIYFSPNPDKFIIKNYEGNVVGVDSEKITFDNGTVLFAYGIKDFDWKTNRSYNITVEYWTVTKSSHIKDVKCIEGTEI